MNRFEAQIPLQRAYALAHPCPVAEACADARYFFGRRITQTMDVSIGLTVNIGQE